MTRRPDWIAGPVEGIVFAIIMALAAYLGRDNPDFVYPQILWCFLSLLAFNLVNFSWLSARMSDRRRIPTAVCLNALLLTAIIYYSGEQDSYFWVLYLLPLFNSCLSLNRKQIFMTAFGIGCALVLFYVDALRRQDWGEILELIIKITTIWASAVVVMRVAFREKLARTRLLQEQKQRDMERENVREKIQHMDRLAILGTMTAGVAHELNSPLNTILGYTELSLAAPFTKEEAIDAFRRIQNNAKRSIKTIQNMLTFSRMHKNRWRMCDINALARECVELKKHDWLLDRIEIKEKYAEGLPPIHLSDSEFQQVIFNLLTNAHQAVSSAGGHGARIFIETAIKDGKVRVFVEDNGPGISAELIEKIWEPFFTTKGPGEGTGLGLSISKQIIEHFGGTLELGRKSGPGAMFVITIPIRSIEPDKGPFETPSAVEGFKAKIASVSAPAKSMPAHKSKT